MDARIPFTALQSTAGFCSDRQPVDGPSECVAPESRDEEARTSKEGRDGNPASPRRTRKTVWDDADIVIDIQYTKPGTALDDHLRKEQTRAVLDLLADYKRSSTRTATPSHGLAAPLESSSSANRHIIQTRDAKLRQLS